MTLRHPSSAGCRDVPVTGEVAAIRAADGPVSLEGRLRELGPPEVMQLLALSRKTGTLFLWKQVHGRAGFIRLSQGAVVDAVQWNLQDSNESSIPEGLATDANAARAVEACVLDLLTWREGEFRFAPEESAASTPVRLAIEMLLVESAQRAEGWQRIADRIPHAHVVPTFVDADAQQPSLLRLEPHEWEVLTRVDGRRDLTELATELGREVLDVASIVHGLIGAGLLVLRESQSAPRFNPTPPTAAPAIAAPTTPDTKRATPTEHASSQPAGQGRDLWIPHGDDVLNGFAGVEDDSLFDPVAMRLLNDDGTLRRRTTPYGIAALFERPVIDESNAVASVVAGTSLLGGEASWPLPGSDLMTLAAQGDQAARRGDLSGAVVLWSAALESEAALVDANRIREAITLASRLHALLHPAARHA